MKSYSIQQKPCQFIAEGCSYQLQRYKNNLKKQMILQENRKIDRNRLTVLRYNEKQTDMNSCSHRSVFITTTYFFYTFLSQVVYK